MSAGVVRFESFTLDAEDRQLRRDGAPVELNARYFDALALLVREAGRLVTKDRFLDEVWRGVPVTDEALTQCIRTLRRQLGDDASRPRFIETVPKHGYRFVAAVETVAPGDMANLLPNPGAGQVGVNPSMHSAGLEGSPHPHPSPSRGGEIAPWRRVLLLAGAGTIGAGVAGIAGGLFYGFGAASLPGAPGGVSVVLLMLWLTIAAALMGGLGVSVGIAAARLARSPLWAIAGGAFGGMIVGGVVKLLGLDAFNLLFGQSPGDITGAPEGILIGGAVGLGAWLAHGRSVRRGAALAALSGGAGGLLVTLLGGRLMGGSLELLTSGIPQSRFRLDAIGALFGESGFGPVSQIVTGTLEGALFGFCVIGAMRLAARGEGTPAPPDD